MRLGSYTPIFDGPTLTNLRPRYTAYALAACAALTALAVLALLPSPVRAQVGSSASAAPTPPRFDAARAIALDLPPSASMRVGVDPQTISIGTDGVVRYVVVAQSSSGLVNAFYEGIKCESAEVIRYAHTLGDAPWTLAQDPPWAPLSDNRPSRHALQFGRQAACEGFTPRRTTRDIVDALRR
jgi:hypothetical protein